VDRKEQIWLGVLIVVALVFNVVTLTPLIPWQGWLLWSKPTPEQTIPIEFGNYEMRLPAGGIAVPRGHFVEFVATSTDVTYGLGVFRPDGTLVFQMQVLPRYQNGIVWKFDRAGAYTIRSTEYSGPKHTQMVIPGAITVTE